MKNIYLLIFCTIISLETFAQGNQNSKQDILQKTTGDELKGKTLCVTDSEITFYSGETAEFVLKRAPLYTK